MIKELKNVEELGRILYKTKSNRYPYYIEHKTRYVRLLQLIKNYHPSGKILDVGSFPFHLLYLLKKEGYEAYGTDFDVGSEKGNKEFIQTNKLTVKKCNIMKDRFPFKDSSFECVLFSEVIEHLANPVNCLFEINRVMKKGGTLILTTPNLYAVGKILKFLGGYGVTEKDLFGNFIQEFTHGYPGHIKEYSPYGINHLLTNSGFRIRKIHFEYYQFKKENRIVIPFYILFPFLRSYQVVIAEKVRDVDTKIIRNKKW